MERRISGARLSPTARVAKIKDVLNAAIKSRNMNTAITEFGAGLSERDLTSLRALTSAELSTMGRVQQKLTRIGGIEERAGDNNNIY